MTGDRWLTLGLIVATVIGPIISSFLLVRLSKKRQLRKRKQKAADSWSDKATDWVARHFRWFVFAMLCYLTSCNAYVIAKVLRGARPVSYVAVIVIAWMAAATMTTFLLLLLLYLLARILTSTRNVQH